ncbi:MAG TPA: TIGR01777 family oxidoreductase [Solirubrobacteraceae bacterium]|nr:TIGR01777 family oxidoreductase [Solirubrobacteraceae bacterium]
MPEQRPPSERRVAVTGASGLVGTALVRALRERGTQVTVLTREPPRALRALGVGPTEGDVQALAWDPAREPAPAEALAGRDAVVNLLGEPIAQRWSARARAAIRESRVTGTANLIAGLARAQPRPPVLVSSSAIGYYGPHGEEPLDEDTPPGGDFLGSLCVEWEAAAARARELGMRVVQLRTGVVLDARRGALARMLPVFRLGLGGPIAGGRQYVSWIHARDLLGMILAALDDERWSGPVNATAPEPVTNREFSRALARSLGRPAVMPVPAFALRARYGEMADVLIGGARVLPAKALVLGYEFSHPRLEPALRSLLAR